MSHSDSPASTVRGSDSGAADDAARAGFLAGALSRLGLTSPAPANQEAQPARPPGAQEGNTSAPPPRKSPEQKRKENKRRNQRRKEARRRRREEEAEKAQQQQQPVDPLGSWTSLSGAVDWSEDAHSVFGSEVTVSLLSHDDAVSYASSIVLASLIPGGSTVPFSKRSTADKLAFYQSLVLQFNLGSQSCLPGSITKCEKILRTVHIAIGDYFDVVKRGGNVATEVPRYKSVSQLRAALCGKKSKKRVPRKLVKSQLLTVFMVRLFR